VFYVVKVVSGLATRRRSKRVETDETAKGIELLFEELTRTLSLELLAIEMVRKKGPPYDVEAILRMAIRMLERKANRSFREDAVLAWARRELCSREKNE
jgi:hypothetical protein